MYVRNLRDIPVGDLSGELSRFDRVRRTPERARIGPIRVELQHPVVELACGRRRFGKAIEISDVLPGLLDDLRAVFPFRLLMSGDHGARLEGLDRVERSDP